MWTHRIGRIGVLVATLVVTGVAGGCDALGLGKDAEVVSSLVITTGCCSLPYGEEQLAGIEIEVSSGGQTHSFTADDFVDTRDLRWRTPPVKIPESGRAFVAITLRQNGAIVSEGSASWTLEPGEKVVTLRRTGRFPEGCRGFAKGPSPPASALLLVHMLGSLAVRDSRRRTQPSGRGAVAVPVPLHSRREHVRCHLHARGIMKTARGGGNGWPAIAENGRCGGTTQAPLRCTRGALRWARRRFPCAGVRRLDRGRGVA